MCVCVCGGDDSHSRCGCMCTPFLSLFMGFEYGAASEKREDRTGNQPKQVDPVVVGG